MDHSHAKWTTYWGPVRCVAHLALYVVLAEDDAVEIIYLEIDDAR